MQKLLAEKKEGLTMVVRNNFTIMLSMVLIAFFVLFAGQQATADERTQAKRIYDRLAGVEPSATALTSMENLLKTKNSTDAIDAAYIAMDNKHFYNTTLVNFITPWTNEARTIFPEDMTTEGTLNDYTATVIGVIANDLDFRRILFDNILYKGKDSLRDASNSPLPTYAVDNNDHYKELEKIPGLNLKNDLEQVIQSDFNSLPPDATSGVLTSRAAAKAFFVDGTNRAMFRFTVLNHLCQDLEQLKDVTRPADRIRQDVSRSPGGDSRIFMNECIGCHSGMDPMTQAFAYYDYEYPLDGNNEPLFAQGQMVYNKVGTTDIDKNGNDTGTRVQAKNHFNADNFKPGFIVPDDSWVNYWREGKNSLLKWDTSLPASGNGASSMAEELSHSEQFARCQVEKVFQTVCLHPPLDSTDRNKVNEILADFKLPFKKSGYELKRVFAETAVYCMGQ